jgi:hypothetical protein
VIAVLVLLAAPGAPAPGTARVQLTAAVAPESGRLCHPRIPQADCDAAVHVYEYATSHNFTPPPGYKGKKGYRNDPPRLPTGTFYYEYDLYPVPAAGGRDGKRIVIDRNTLVMHYTADHYRTFVQLTYS